MKDEIYVVYCYYPFFHRSRPLPLRKWRKCNSREEARKFVAEKVEPKENRFLWAYVINGKEYEKI